MRLTTMGLTTIRLTTLFFLVAFFGSYSNSTLSKELTRGNAKKLLEKQSFQTATSSFYGRFHPSTFDQPNSKHMSSEINNLLQNEPEQNRLSKQKFGTMFRGLEANGFIKINELKDVDMLNGYGRPIKYSGIAIIPTQKLEPYILSTNVFDEYSSRSNAEVTLYSVKIFEYKVDKVTGISNLGESFVKVEYTLKPEFTPIAKYILDEELLARLQVAQLPPRSQFFQLYDDGWRIEKTQRLF